MRKQPQKLETDNEISITCCQGNCFNYSRNASLEKMKLSRKIPQHQFAVVGNYCVNSLISKF